MYCLLRYSQKTGKVDTCITSGSAAMLEFHAVRKTTKTKETVVVDLVTEQIIYTVTGRKDGSFPDIDTKVRSAAACGITPDFMADMRRCD